MIGGQMRSCFKWWQRGVLATVTVCSLGMGIVMLPSTALAEEGLPEEQIEQLASVSDNNDVAPETETVSEDEALIDATDQDETVAVTGDSVDALEDEETDQATDQVADAKQDAPVEAEDATEVTTVAKDDERTLTTASDDAPALPEGSQEVTEGTYVIEAGLAATDKTGLAGLVLDAQGSVREGAKLITWTYNGNDNQKWHIAKTESGWYTIMPDSDRTLALTATKDRGLIYLSKLVEGLASQLWAFVTNSTSYGNGLQMVPQGLQQSLSDATITYLDNAKALDVRGGKPEKRSEFITYTRSTTPKGNQSFYLVDTAREAVSGGETTLEGKYRVKVPSTNLALEIRRALTTNGANVWVYEQNGKPHQDVYLQYEGNGFYSVWIMGTNKVLDVRGGSILPGTNVIQWTYSGKDNQLWSVRKNADGSYTLVNKMTGLSLGAASESTASNGTNLTGAQNNGRANNSFTLIRSALLAPGIYKIKDANNKVLDVSKASTANGAKLSFYKDNNALNQRFELVSAGGTDLWRIRTASSGGWINYVPSTDVTQQGSVTQQGNHATAASENDTWQIVWHSGSYKIKSVIDGHVLGGASKTVTPIKTGIVLKTGLVEIDARLSGVALDNPKGSTTAGTKINVYKDNNGDNQKFIVEQVSGGYIITNLKSGKVLAVSGSSVVQQTYKSGDKNQVWTAGIADGGFVKLINNGTKKALDITGNSTVGTGSTATQVTDDTASREARQSWKLVGSTGWAKYKNVMSYFKSGKQITTSSQAWVLYNDIKNMSSMTKYLIAIYTDKPRFLIFKGKAGAWEPIHDWECATGMPGDDGKSCSFRGAFRLGDGAGEQYNDGEPLTMSAGVYGKSVDLPGYSGATYGYFLNGVWAIHSTINGSSEASQMNKRISHGCIRLTRAHASWVYHNMPRYTRVWSRPRAEISYTNTCASIPASMVRIMH